MDRIQEIKERCERATLGPLVVREIGSTPSIEKECGGILANMTHYWPMKHDAEFFAHAREDIPFLLSEIEKRSHELSHLKETITERDAEILRLNVWASDSHVTDVESENIQLRSALKGAIKNIQAKIDCECGEGRVCSCVGLDEILDGLHALLPESTGGDV